MKKDIWRAVTEIGFIIFLFYSNLLMGEFTRSGMARGKDLAWAIQDIFSEVNFALEPRASMRSHHSLCGRCTSITSAPHATTMPRRARSTAASRN